MSGPRSQMGGVLARFDDEHGLAWRAANKLRRANVRRALRTCRALIRPPELERPVFVVGAPRSGTTLLFHVLRESPSLGSLPWEGHDLWRTFHHPRLHGWRSDAVGAGELWPGEQRYIRARFAAHVRVGRFVEKTPENSLRIPYLLDLFPDAVFVAIHRRPLDVLASLIEGWRDPAGRFRSYTVPTDLDIPDYPHRRRWCFALVEGWGDLRSAPLADIAFEQWRQCVAGLAEGRRALAPHSWVDVHLEDIVRDGSQALRDVYRVADVVEDPAMAARLSALRTTPVNALIRGAGGSEIADEVDRLTPLVAAFAADGGYTFDAATGSITIIT